jgi:hypothetical protein
VGITQRHMQTVMDELVAAKQVAREIGRGVTNTYRLLAPLVPWVRAMIEGEARAAVGKAAASDPPTAQPHPRIPWAILDHHPQL